MDLPHGCLSSHCQSADRPLLQESIEERLRDAHADDPKSPWSRNALTTPSGPGLHMKEQAWRVDANIPRRVRIRKVTVFERLALLCRESLGDHHCHGVTIRGAADQARE